MKVLKLLTVLTVLLIFGFSLWLDLAFGIYTDWIFQVVMALIVALLVIWVTNKLESNLKCLIVSGCFIMMLSIRYWDYNSHKPFMRTLDNLEKGMTKEEVIHHMRAYTLAGQGKGFIFLTEKQEEPKLDDKVEYLNFTHTEEGWGDSDWGIVYFIDNKLYRTGFSHD